MRREPFGVNRLRPPQPVEQWSGVRDALTFGPKAPQVSGIPPPIDEIIPELAIPGEDCLSLNIWSPDLGSSPATGNGLDSGRYVSARNGRYVLV